MDKRLNKRTKNKIDDIADRLIELYAKRMSSPGFAFSKDNELQIDFENQFGYALTADQQRSVDEIKLDIGKTSTNGSSFMWRCWFW